MPDQHQASPVQLDSSTVIEELSNVNLKVNYLIRQTIQLVGNFVREAKLPNTNPCKNTLLAYYNGLKPKNYLELLSSYTITKDSSQTEIC